MESSTPATASPTSTARSRSTAPSGSRSASGCRSAPRRSTSSWGFRRRRPARADLNSTPRALRPRDPATGTSRARSTISTGRSPRSPTRASSPKAAVHVCARAARGSASCATRRATGSSSSSARRTEGSKGWSQLRRGAQRTLMRSRAPAIRPSGFRCGANSVSRASESTPSRSRSRRGTRRAARRDEPGLGQARGGLSRLCRVTRSSSSASRRWTRRRGRSYSCLRVSVARRRPWSIPQPSWCWAAAREAALPVSSFEYWYVAEGPYQRGEYEEAVRVRMGGVEGLLPHPHLNFSLPSTARSPARQTGRSRPANRRTA